MESSVSFFLQGLALYEIRLSKYGYFTAISHIGINTKIFRISLLSTYNILETYWAVFNNTLAVRYINKQHITFLSVPYLKLFMTIP